jgi:Phosphotransferase enzyme family
LNSGIDRLAAVIAAHLHEWDPSPPFVERAIYECADAYSIAGILNAFCMRNLCSPIAGGLFHQSSVGSVTGVVLDDGRSIVIKAHQPERSREFVADVVRVQSYLAQRHIFATQVVAGPLRLGRGYAIVEAFTDIGSKADAHRPEIRGALAASLHAVVRACNPLVEATSLGPSLLASAGDALWPTPHSKLFDFAASAKGAGWIDDLAKRARDQMRPVGNRVIGHCDWRVEHVRFLANTPVVAFDWDSLCCEREPALIGVVANGFCADWSQGDNRQAPSLDEARAFVHDYERARGKMFSAEERRLCGAGLAYASAYTARCAHAGGRDERGTPGTFQHLVWSERTNLFEL